jgi:DNA polymerase I-like protein with 3'-5' exonuclease and polymerase domains
MQTVAQLTTDLEAPVGASSRQIIMQYPQLLREFNTGWMGQDFAIDLETTGLDYTRDRILGVALTFADGRSYYLVFEHTEPLHEQFVGDSTEAVTLYPSRTHLPRIGVCRGVLQDLLAQEDVTVIAHNLKFELHFLSKQGVQFYGKLVDTMLAAQLIDENRRVGLKTFGSLVGMPLKNYTELEHYPGFAKQEILGLPLDVAAHYAMDDTAATWALWQLFEPQLAEEGVEHAFYDIWMPLLHSLQEMEARGIAMDIDGVREAAVKYEKIAQEAEHAVWRVGIEMVLDRYVNELDWLHIPDAYLKTLHTLDEPYEDAGDGVIVRGVALPVWRKYNKNGSESRAFKPRIPWFNPGSTAQIKELLWQHLGLPAAQVAEVFDLKFGGDENDPIYAADRDNLTIIKSEMGEKCPQVVNDLLTFRKASKLLSTYLRTYEERCDASDSYCLRTNFNQASTDTGRLSSSRPNLQNQPARGEEGRLIRSLFIARPGYKLVVADYSMMELRLAAHFSGDPVMVGAFKQGLDLHAVTAASQQGVEYGDFMDSLAQGDPQATKARFIGKTSNFGLLYGMGPHKFQKLLLVDAGVKVSLDEAFELVEQFNDTYETLTRWKRELSRWIVEHEYIDTIAGRKRRLPSVASPVEWIRRGALRQGINARIQGSCADIICEVIPPIQDQFVALGGSLLLQVHDELVGEVPHERAELAAGLMSKMMTETTRDFLVPLVAEAGIGDTWGGAK